jgi:uncharacterized ion transporter superfamily protein YfcC
VGRLWCCGRPGSSNSPSPGSRAASRVFTAALTNPVTLGLGQSIAGLPLYSGLAFRAVLFAIVLTMGILYVMRYVRREPEYSSVHVEDQAKRANGLSAGDEQVAVTPRQKIASVVALGFIGLLLYGVLGLGWFMLELAGLFIVMGAVVGLIAGLRGTEIYARRAVAVRLPCAVG